MLDRPLGLQEVETPRISRQSVHEGGKVVKHKHRPTLLHWTYQEVRFHPFTGHVGSWEE